MSKVFFRKDRKFDFICICKESKLLEDLLTDNGGIDLKNTLENVKEIIMFLTQIKKNQIESYVWNRETFGGIITKDSVKIYSLHDETHNETIRFDLFNEGIRELFLFLNRYIVTKMIDEN